MAPLSDAEIRRSVWDRASNSYRRLVDTPTVTWDTSTPGLVTADATVTPGSVAAEDIAFTPNGSIAATDVQAAIQEVRDEAQPLDADLTTIAGLTRTRGDLIVGGAAAWADLALGASRRRLTSDGTDAVWSNVLHQENAIWFTGRDAANGADLNLFRVNSDDFTEWSNPLYYDNGTSGPFVDRSAVFHIQRNLGASAPAGVIPNFWSYVESKGDNATVVGGSAGVFYSADRGDVTGSNKGVLYGLQIIINPIVDRDNSPFDDAAGLVVQLNDNAKKGTDAIYVGNATGVTGPQWVSGVLVQTDADYAYRAVGDFQYGLDFVAGGPAVFSVGAIRIPNASNILGRNQAGGADVAMLKVATDDSVQLRDGIVSVFSTHVLFTQPAIFPNTGVQIFDTNASHRLSIVPGSDLTDARTLTLTTGDASRTVTLSGNPTLDDWFDQSVKAAASPTFASLTLTAGLRVGFAGSPTADRIEVGDATFYLDLGAVANHAGLTFDTNDAILYNRADDVMRFFVSGVERFNIDDTATAGQTALLVYDVDNNALERVTVGAADSGGSGFKVLRIPN